MSPAQREVVPVQVVDLVDKGLRVHLVCQGVVGFCASVKLLESEPIEDEK